MGVRERERCGGSFLNSGVSSLCLAGLSKNNDVSKGCYQTIPLTWLCLSFSDSKEWAFFGLFENTDIRYILSQLIFSAETFWSIFYVCLLSA